MCTGYGMRDAQNKSYEMPVTAYSDTSRSRESGNPCALQDSRATVPFFMVHKRKREAQANASLPLMHLEARRQKL